MLDINLIINHSSDIKNKLLSRGYELSVNKLEDLYYRRKDIIKKKEDLAANKNQISDQFKTCKDESEREKLKTSSVNLENEIQSNKDKLLEIENNLKNILTSNISKAYLNLKLNEEKIISLLNEFANPKKMASFFINNATTDFLFIRPSGNPIDAKGFEQMITGDIVQEKAEITKIHRFEFLSENIVMCIFTLGSKFTYKGTPNDDLPTVTSIFKKVNNVWKIHWMQRSTGNSDLSIWD